MVKQKPSIPPVEIWGGIECTVNRVNDRYYDQLIRSGHHIRPADIERIAALGIRTMRYPLLWERTAPDRLSCPDWQWADERLAFLQKANIQPIIGLTHHGSGPRYTHLLEPSFATGLAEYARIVAERYPWIDAYTPVNEPLTTARFSGLYGLWYPHKRSDLACMQMLLNECRATVLAMQEIRKVNPVAKLVQTEDMGQCHSTPLLAYQAKFENDRRWLTYDLLCGKVNKQHALWNYLIKTGIAEEELHFFHQNPCPPDIIGINHYITSERYLDERLKQYPKHVRGGNGRHRYADIEAVRTPAANLVGPYGLLKQVWERYHLPIAITEVHLGCTHEEQIRWFYQVWNAANRAKSEGMDIQAITAWSLLGSYDWNSLLTVDRGHYESGVFDLRSSPPRPTALANLIKEIISAGQATHPTLKERGWWQKPERWLYTGHPELQAIEAPVAQPLLITGATGTLGQAFARMCKERGLTYHVLDRQMLDITNREQVRSTIERLNPWAIINTAGYVRVAQAEAEPEKCYRENTIGAAMLAEMCREKQVQLLTFSTDLVFDGTKAAPYVETDCPNPQSVYGGSKAAAEKAILRRMPDALIIRTSAFFGPWDEYNFVTNLLNAFAVGQPFGASSTEEVSPTYVPDLVHASLNLLIDGEKGIWHLTNEDEVSWAELGRMAALQAGYDPDLVEEWYVAQVQNGEGKARKSTALVSSRGKIMPKLSHALTMYLQHCECLQPII